MKLLKLIFLYLFAFLLSNAVSQFLLNTKYSFTQPVAFHGGKLFNPYQGMDSTKWKKANFHLHTRQLLGLMAGAPNTVEAADTFYKYFGYDISGISDYMKINADHDGDENFIPTYEHGIMIHKTHQLVINSGRTCWKDFFFRETLNDKQYIINCLKKDTSALVAIVHPKIRNAYRNSDFRYLGNYDFLEIANSRSLFISLYDTALSAGHKIFVMANDDAHNLSDITDGAHSFNMINGESDKNSVLSALKTGKSYAVCFNVHPYKTNYQKKAALSMLPVIKAVDLRNDTIFVRTDLKVDTIRFIGQNGAVRKISTDCKTADYEITKNDTYVRTEIVCKDGTVYFLNPVFRYNDSFISPGNPEDNTTKSALYRIPLITLFVIILFLSRKPAMVIQ
jgi:hypothetical protein